MRPRLLRLALGIASLFLAALCFPRPAAAGIYTYADVLPGDRAAQMGGAFAALADDATATFYNPAGLLAASHDNVSMSANTYSSRDYRAKGSLFGQDLKADGTSFVPTALASALRFESLPGFALGLSIVVPEDTTLSSKQRIQAQLFEGIESEITLDFDSEARTYYLGPSFAWAPWPELRIGGTVFGVYGSESADTTFVLQDALPGSAPLVTAFSFQKGDDTKFGVTALVGAQWLALEGLTFGVVVRPPVSFRHERELRTSVLVLDDSGLLIPAPGLGETQRSDFDEDMPASVTTGVAFTPGQRLTLSLDGTVYFGRSFPTPQGTVARHPTWNVNAGVEWYPIEVLPVRAGVFTNRSAAPRLRPDSPFFVDTTSYVGFSAGLGYQLAYAELTGGVRMAWGDGETPSVSDPTRAAKTDASETSVLLGLRFQY